MDKANRMVYTKSRLIKELAFRVGIKQVLSRKTLEVLTEIAYREAAKSAFVLPGLCKLELVDRKARRLRNPRTGEALVLPPRKALRITAARAAKNAIAPHVSAIPAADYVPPAPAPEPAEAPAAVPAATPAEAANKAAADGVPPVVPFSEALATTAEARPAPASDLPISFRCHACHQEIEAPGEAAGMEAECPMCGGIVVIPAASEPGTMHAPAAGDAPTIEKTVVSAQEAEEIDPGQLMNRTIRIDASMLDLDESPAKGESEKIISFFCKKCQQEIEAPADMAGQAADCPNCGESVEVPYFSEAGTLYGGEEGKTGDPLSDAQKRSTMRIDLSDDF